MASFEYDDDEVPEEEETCDLLDLADQHLSQASYFLTQHTYHLQQAKRALEHYRNVEEEPKQLPQRIPSRVETIPLDQLLGTIREDDPR